MLQTQNGFLSIRMSKTQDTFANFKKESKVGEKALFDKLRYREEKENVANECNVKIFKLNDQVLFDIKSNNNFRNFSGTTF